MNKSIILNLSVLSSLENIDYFLRIYFSFLIYHLSEKSNKYFDDLSIV